MPTLFVLPSFLSTRIPFLNVPCAGSEGSAAAIRGAGAGAGTGTGAAAAWYRPGEAGGGSASRFF